MFYWHIWSVQELLHKCRVAPLLTRCHFTVPSNHKLQGSRGVTTVCLVYTPPPTPRRSARMPRLWNLHLKHSHKQSSHLPTKDRQWICSDHVFIWFSRSNSFLFFFLFFFFLSLSLSFVPEQCFPSRAAVSKLIYRSRILSCDKFQQFKGIWAGPFEI